MPAEARRCAFQVVRRVFEQDAYADRALQAQAGALDGRDRALAMRLAFGTIQRKGTLDHLIERLASRPTERLDPPVLAALRLGLYELLYLAGAPDWAVVADAVELAKAGPRGAHGLVNAVLRRAAREGRERLLGPLRDDTPEQAAIEHSHPAWLAQLWWRELGAERAKALMAADNGPGELALRVNTLRASIEEVAAALAALPAQARRDPAIPEALVIDGPLDVHGLAAWREGKAIAQSRAAMLVAHALGPEPGERVLDLCAAPGGKSTHLAALMEDRGEVVAVELNPARAAALQATARRLGAGIVRVEVSDAARRRPAGDSFDRVLVDPPCSGLGTLQARPDLRWRMSLERIAEMQGLQAAILAAGASALRPGGVLVYSTCTVSAAENERQVQGFLKRHENFALEDLGVRWPAYAHGGEPGTLQTLPHRDRTAGFFVARLRRSI
jgi:16S rRNA (cytosine967-C5)-methyltransferase